MKKDKLLEARELGQRRAEKFFDLVPEEARDGYITNTEKEVAKYDLKQAKIKGKLKKYRKLGPNPNMNALGTMTVLGLSEVATMGAAALISQGTDYQLASVASGFVLGAGVGFANIYALYTRPATNAYRSFRRKMLNRKLDKIEEHKEFSTSFLDKFKELREEEMGM